MTEIKKPTYEKVDQKPQTAEQPADNQAVGRVTGDTRDSIDRSMNFNTPMGFSSASGLGMFPARISDYAKNNMTVPNPGEYCQDNGVISAINTNGEVVVWFPTGDSNRDMVERTVSYKTAIQNLKNSGYRESSFSVSKFTS